jgi:2-polyprenyl-3-methyl-5-hydroxy-6-metoxy-1,4-benzoquinol methylase
MSYAFHSYTDAFSIIYDRRWGRYASSRAPILISFLENRFGLAPGETRVCDLCCGTGQLTRKLADNGYRVHAIDQSPGMIALCRRNNQESIDRGMVEASQQRAQEFHLPKQADVTVSLFDSLNHLPSMSDLSDTFRSAAAATKR